MERLFYRQVGALGPALIDEVTEWASRQAGKPGGFWVSEREQRVDLGLRKSRVLFLRQGETLADRILARLSRVAECAAPELGLPRMPLTAPLVQHSVYPSDGGHYTWHPDISARPNLPEHVTRRRLSMSVLLQPADDGGLLELEGVGSVDLSVDEAVAFLPHRRHRVSPVLAGERVSLTAWFLAPERLNPRIGGGGEVRRERREATGRQPSRCAEAGQPPGNCSEGGAA